VANLVKVVNNNLDQNLNGTNFTHTASETIFTFGDFAVTSNFEGRKFIDYTNTLSSFVRPVTLETLGVTSGQSAIMDLFTNNAVLNLDRSDLNTFVKFGSAYEFLRVSIQNIIVAYPGSVFANSQTNKVKQATFTNFTYDVVTNVSTFRVPTGMTVNTFGIITNFGNMSIPDGQQIKNLNVSYNNYIVWSALAPSGNSFTIIGYTGNTASRKYLTIKTTGNPFPYNTGSTGSFDFHIKPSSAVFEEFRATLSDYERYIVSQRNGTDGFMFTMKDPTLLDDGSIVYSDTQIVWTTGDKYNIDTNTPKYRNFLSAVLGIGNKYDTIKTDLIARFLTPASLKTYDLTEEGKMTKLLRIYGREFDQLKQFIDSLVDINRVTYDKINNVPDQLISNMARTFGWNYFSLVNENELVQSFLTISDAERNLKQDLLPAEIDIELWRRILLNTSYFWKSKGTREAIKSMFLLIGIPEPFINITEYVYTVEGKIDPNTVGLTLADFPSNSLPYDTDGYPQAPLETSDFFFQISGDTDAGQHYMDVFRTAGFDLRQNVDNRKSWVQAGAVTRVDSTTPQYFQQDSKLVLNTKEVDIALDTARGIEFDVYDYINGIDFPANSSGFTLPFSYVNISLGVSATQSTFNLPAKTQGDFEVRYNGILLNAPKTGSTTGISTQADYSINYIANTFTITNPAINTGNRRDVIQVTYIYSGNTHPVSGITVEYIVTRVSANPSGTAIPLPSFPRGDVQVTINGIALTKGTPQFAADYVVDPANTSGSSQIIITNTDLINYLTINPDIQVAYVQVVGSNDINARSEVVRIDSFNSSKIYFNNSANKYVYKLNYKANNASEIKVLIDGIALEPYTDYDINIQNQYEVFLPKGLRYGTIISVYYLVALSSFFTPIVGNTFGVGDISTLSFLEFIELIQRKMINARTRKTVTDFKGGWYPSLLNVYIQYLKRGLLPESDPLHSNGYTFENLYGFLSKYNSFFQRFVDKLLSATIILKESGLLIRNTVFTKQKFTYKRGVNLYSGGSSTIDLRGNAMLQYLGDDGSTFQILQGAPAPSATIPTVITSNIINITQTGATGGGNVTSNGGSLVTSRGICWDTVPAPTIGDSKTINGNGVGVFTSTLTGLLPNTRYYVRAYAINVIGVAYGNEISFLTADIVPAPMILTKPASSFAQTTITNTGGYGITGFTGIDYYAMQYAFSSITPIWQLSPPAPLVGPLGVNNFTLSISALAPNTDYMYRAYMVVNGSPFYGNILNVHTLSFTPTLPVVTTAAVTSITTSDATTGGDVTSSGTDASGNPETVTERGIVYGLAPNPTTGNTKIISGSGLGAFVVNLTGLVSNTTYFVRAYAINGAGLVYGNQITFTTVALPVFNIGIVRTGSGGTGGGAQSNGTINPSPALSAGQTITLSLNICHVIFGTTFGQNLTTIYCSTNNGATYSIISPSPFTTNSPSSPYPNRNVSQHTLGVTLHQNERLCYVNQVGSAMNSTGTCACLSISSYSNSGNISVIVSSNCDCIVI
jgi:hypothetical protein